ncbi:MAG: TRAP transporter substrate-binding protein DctP, partial [Lawsonibacter sp.]|nr:TRAP transporter substrate-binding protein DctP [Lawsonibacter sp.]
MKKFFVLMLASAMTLSMVACGSTKTPSSAASSAAASSAATSKKETTAPIVISLSNAYSDMDQVNVELKAAAENIAKRTNGGIDLKVYPNNTFGAPADCVEAIRSDAPLMYVTAFSQWEDYYPDACAIQAGFVFDSAEECVRFYDTDLFTEIVANLDAVNIHCINCNFTAGMRHVLGKSQIKTPEDMKGLKLRVPASSPYLDCFNALGASPMAMSSSEQIGALSAGTIDAVDQSISLMYSTKTYELVKECTLLAQM